MYRIRLASIQFHFIFTVCRDSWISKYSQIRVHCTCRKKNRKRSKILCNYITQDKTTLSKPVEGFRSIWNLTISNFRVIFRVACFAKVRNSSLHMIVKQNCISELPSDSLSPPPSSWRKWVFFFRCWLAWFPSILLCFLIKFRSMAFRVFFGDVSV